MPSTQPILLSIGKLFTDRGTAITGFGSLITGTTIGDPTTGLPWAAKRRIDLNTISSGQQSSSTLPAIPNTLSRGMTTAAVNAVNGYILSLIPVGFSSSQKIDGGIMEIKAQSGTSTRKVAFHVVVDTPGAQQVRFYSKEFRAGADHPHAGLLMLGLAYVYPQLYPDIMDAMDKSLSSIKSHGRLDPVDPNQKQALGLLSDELVMGLTFGPNQVSIGEITVELYAEDPPAEQVQSSPDIAASAFTDLKEFKNVSQVTSRGLSTTQTSATVDGRIRVDVEYMGEQANQLADATMRGLHSLLTGATETGKTLMVESVCMVIGAPLFKETGHEGLKDKDVMGGMMMVNGTSEFIPGKLPQAMEAGAKQAKAQQRENRAAIDEGREAKRLPPAVLYIDEFNRMETRYQNLFVGAVNVRYGTNDYYVHIPETGKEYTCPVGYFVLVAARNFGSAYVGINEMDLAVIRRFHRKFDVQYLDLDKEIVLVVRQTGLKRQLAEVLCRTAQSIRIQSSQLQAPLGTGSVIEWAKELVYRESHGDKLTALEPLIKTADIIWIEMVAGRDEYGVVDQVNRDIVIADIGTAWTNVFRGKKGP